MPRRANKLPYKGFKRKIPWAFTATPNRFIDTCLRTLEGSECIALLAIERETWGRQKDSDTIAEAQLITLTGLPQRTLQRALNGLEAKGHITRSGPARRTRTFAINWPPRDDFGSATCGTRENIGSATYGTTVAPYVARFQRKKETA